MLATRTLLGFDGEPIDYATALEIQADLRDRVHSGEIGDQLLLVEHAAVYTAGRRTEDHERPQDGTPVIDVDRGGRITWHGPGQLVGYPIIRLADPSAVRLYVEQLQDALIEVVGELGIDAEEVEGRSGVWIRGTGGRQDAKIAAIGIRVHEGVTMHGFALNCSHSLEPFSTIVPCGIADAGVTTISEQLGREVAPADLLEPITTALSKHITA